MGSTLATGKLGVFENVSAVVQGEIVSEDQHSILGRDLRPVIGTFMPESKQE